MNPELPELATEFATTAARAFVDVGGVDIARRAEEDPATREDVAKLLAALGVDDLDARADDDSLAAAAALCEVAGRVALPYPIAATLLRNVDGAPFAVVQEGSARVDHGDLFPRWRVASLAGGATYATPDGSLLATRLGPFVADLALEATADPLPDGTDSPLPGGTDKTLPDGTDKPLPQHTASPLPDGTDRTDGTDGTDSRTSTTEDIQRYLTLSAWQVLGTTDRAVELAVAHVTDRIQFGKPLSAFQAVQFQLADAAVAVAGLRELAHFTLWRLALGPREALADVLALRVHALDVARSVLRTTQQLHGAAGVCDEYDISVLARHVQPLLRLPFGADVAAERLAGAIASEGFTGLFPHGGDLR